MKRSLWVVVFFSLVFSSCFESAKTEQSQSDSEETTSPLKQGCDVTLTGFLDFSDIQQEIDDLANGLHSNTGLEHQICLEQALVRRLDDSRIEYISEQHPNNQPKIVIKGLDSEPTIFSDDGSFNSEGIFYFENTFVRLENLKLVGNSLNMGQQGLVRVIASGLEVDRVHFEKTNDPLVYGMTSIQYENPDEGPYQDADLPLVVTNSSFLARSHFNGTTRGIRVRDPIPAGSDLLLENLTFDLQGFVPRAIETETAEDLDPGVIRRINNIQVDISCELVGSLSLCNDHRGRAVYLRNGRYNELTNVVVNGPTVETGLAVFVSKIDRIANIQTTGVEDAFLLFGEIDLIENVEIDNNSFEGPSISTETAVAFYIRPGTSIGTIRNVSGNTDVAFYFFFSSLGFLDLPSDVGLLRNISLNVENPTEDCIQIVEGDDINSTATIVSQQNLVCF